MPHDILFYSKPPSSAMSARRRASKSAISISSALTVGEKCNPSIKDSACGRERPKNGIRLLISAFRRLEKDARTTRRKAGLSCSLISGSARVGKCTKALSTLGGGVKQVRGTDSFVSGSVVICAKIASGPHPVSRGRAVRRRAASFCTITLIDRTGVLSDKNFSISGVVR